MACLLRDFSVVGSALKQWSAWLQRGYGCAGTVISVITAWVGVRWNSEQRYYSVGRSAVEQWSAFIALLGVRWNSDQRDYSVGRGAVEQWSAFIALVGVRWNSDQRDYSVGRRDWNSDQPDAQIHTIITLHPDTTPSVGLPWNSDQPAAQSHTINTLHTDTTYSFAVPWNSDQPDSHNNHNRHTSMPPAEFEPAFPATSSRRTAH